MPFWLCREQKIYYFILQVLLRADDGLLPYEIRRAMRQDHPLTTYKIFGYLYKWNDRMSTDQNFKAWSVMPSRFGLHCDFCLSHRQELGVAAADKEGPSMLTNLFQLGSSMNLCIEDSGEREAASAGQ